MLSASQVEFFAEDALIEIIPKFQADSLNLLTGCFGPFIPQTPVEVPLWLAVALKRQGKCAICAPYWLSKTELAEIVRLERVSSIQSLQPLPKNFSEIALILLQHSGEDLPEAAVISSYLEDIENLRQHKIRRGLQAMAEEQTREPVNYLKLNNATTMETNAIRPLLLVTLDKFYKLYAQGSAAIAQGREYQRELEERLDERENIDLYTPNRSLPRSSEESPSAEARTRSSQETHITQNTYDSEDDALILKNSQRNEGDDATINLREQT